jgi:hypothetical protein
MRFRARVVVPFNFGLEPRIPIIFTVLWDRIIIVPQPFEGVNVLSYITDDFASLNGPQKGRVFWRMNQKFKVGEDKFIRKVIVNDQSENFFEGTIDLLKSTGFDIYFEFPDKYLRKKEKDKDPLKEKVNEILSYFINQYRTVANEVDIHNPSNLDFPVIDLHYSKKKFKSDIEIIDGEYKFHSRILSTLKPEQTGYFKKTLSPDKMAKLIDNLNSSKPVQIHMQLLVDAKEYAIIRKDYKTSIILSATATEVFLQTSFIGECQFRRIKTLTKEFKGFKKNINFIEAILEADLKENLLGDIGKFLTGENIKSSKQYQEWEKYACKIRKEVIHKARLYATEEEAIKAFETVINFITYISGLLIKSRKK